jgi:hypothetical protein
VVIVVLCSWSGRLDHEHSTAINTIRRQNQRLLLQLWAPDDGRENTRNMLSCK